MTLPVQIGADANLIATGLPASTGVTFEVYFSGVTSPSTITNTPAQVGATAAWQVTLTDAERDNDNAKVVISGATVVGQSRDFVNPEKQGVATADQVAALSAGSGAGINIEITEDNTGAPIKGATFVGSQVGTFANLEAEDGVYHQITHAANTFDIVYGANVTGARVAVEATFTGYLSSSNDTATIQVYDFIGTAWETVGTIPGQSGSTNIGTTIKLLQKHTGTAGADTGKVYIRILSTGSGPVLNGDQLLVAASSLGQSVGYDDGAIWVDTVNGVAGTVPYVNGTADNPALTWADALTLSGTTKLKKFKLSADSSIILTGNSDGLNIEGIGSTVELNGQSLSGIAIDSCLVSGDDSGTNAIPARFVRCGILGQTLGQHTLLDCGVFGDMVMAEAGGYLWENCFSEVGKSPAVDFGAAVGDCAFNAAGYNGYIEVRRMGVAGTDTMRLTGVGDFVEGVGNVAGQVDIAGNISLASVANLALNDIGRVAQDALLLSNVTYWQGDALTGTKMITDPSGTPAWTVAAMANARGTNNASTHSAADVANAIGTRQVPDAVAAPGVRPTYDQALYMVHQEAVDFEINAAAPGTSTLTIRKPDSTALATLTLNGDETTPPTSKTRAT